MNSSLIKSKKIKLVIWDLDNTLWEGTLAENESVRIYPYIKNIIKTLNQRGIVNSICSKNDYSIAKQKMVEDGIWGWFVFPSIDFQPKGPRVSNIIADMNLRAENVLYIDDDFFILHEVKFNNPKINVLPAYEAEKILAESSLKGNDDFSLTRLNQYHQLEKRKKFSRESNNNIEFLKSIHIKIQLMEYTPYLFDRIYELIDRTNQLNFTKNRMSKYELKDMLEDTSIECNCVRVLDDFGDSGIVGFYAKKDDKLIHFMFSCRIINIGIEQWVYTKIGEPILEIQEPVASYVKKGLPLYDYITEVGNELYDINEDILLNSFINDSKKLNIYALGACDLYRMVSNLGMPTINIVFECNVFRGNNRSVNVGTEYIRSIFQMNNSEKKFCEKHFSNYRGDLAFNTKIKSGNYDFCIFSFHDDFTYYIYENITKPYIHILRRNEPVYNDDNTIMDRSDEKAWLENNFFKPHLISPERFHDNLKWLRNNIPRNTKMILVNGPELKAGIEDEYNTQIIILNKVINDFVFDKENNAELVDVNRFIKSQNDFSDYIFHWSTETSFNITLECFKKMSLHGREQAYDLFEGLQIKNKKLVLYGKDKFTKLAYYALKSHGFDIEGIYYSESLEGTIKPAKLLEGKKEEYYVIVTQGNEKIEIETLLMKYEYIELKNYIIYRPVNYIHHWSEHD